MLPRSLSRGNGAQWPARPDELSRRRYVTADPAGPAGTRDGCTELERQIITLVGAGHTVHEIAQPPEVSTSAVAHTKRRIYRKLQIGCQGQAAALGIVARQPPRDRSCCGAPRGRRGRW